MPGQKYTEGLDQQQCSGSHLVCMLGRSLLSKYPISHNLLRNGVALRGRTSILAPLPVSMRLIKDGEKWKKSKENDKTKLYLENGQCPMVRVSVINEDVLWVDVKMN